MKSEDGNKIAKTKGRAMRTEAKIHDQEGSCMHKEAPSF